jgi:hypothetical protein
VSYRKLLRDPRWQKKRLKILERDDWTCQRCGSTDRELQVHHLVYAGAPWDVPDDALVTLCVRCHTALKPQTPPVPTTAEGWEPYFAALRWAQEEGDRQRLVNWHYRRYELRRRYDPEGAVEAYHQYVWWARDLEKRRRHHDH